MEGVPLWGGPRLGLTVLDPSRAVALELQANREPDFNSLVSPLSPRRVAARVFYLLLGEYGHVCRAHNTETTIKTLSDWPILPLLTSARDAADPSRRTREAIRASPDSARATIPQQLEPS